MKPIPFGLLTELAEATARALGCHDDEAREVGAHLVGANLAGHDSHGIGMLPTYVELAETGLLIPNRELNTLADLPALLVLDADRGFGQWMGRLAMERGIERAKMAGSCTVALRNSSHIGRIGTYAEQCAASGMVSIHFVNVAGHEPVVAPFGGSDGRFITNPFAVGVPGRGGPSLVLDMATSKIAFGKARVARNKGVPVPDGSLLDESGRPTTDPTALVDDRKGALVAFGDHKGSGLAVLCEVLGGALTGGRTSQPAYPRDDSVINSMLTTIIDVKAMGDIDAFVAEVEAVRRHIKASPPAPGVDEVLMPGEPEARARATRMRDGVPIDPKSLSDILDAAAVAGVDDTLIARVRESASP